ncbi:MAG: GAF domain-containing protein [Planctomycetota bacterium]
MSRNLQRLRSSGRVPIARPSDEGRVSGAGRTSTRLKPVRSSSTKLNPVRKSSGNLTPVGSPHPESELFRAMVPAEDPQLEALRAEVANLRRLQEVIHFLGSASDAHTLRAEILDLALSLSGLTRGMIALPAKGRGKQRRFKVRESRGYEERHKPELKLLRGVLNRALERREPFFDGSIRDGGILDHAESSARELDLGAVACITLEAGGELWGAIILDDPRRKEPFLPAEESLLRSFGRHAGLALARLQRAAQMKKRLTLTARKNERLEAERDQLEERLETESKRAARAAPDSSEARRRSARTSSQSARHDKKLEKSGREYRRLLEVSYGRAREDFTRRYLEELLRRAEGDLRVAAQESGLPVARLIGLLEKLEVPVPPRRLPLPERRPEDHGSTASRWGQPVRR